MQSPTNFVEETPPSPQTPGLEILEGAATDSGVKFEQKLAALLLLRAHRRGFIFSIYRNVAAAIPFDDIVVEITINGAPCLVMAQLKHGEERGTSISLQGFCQKKKEDGKPEKGDFNLRKYFQLFERFYNVHEKRGEPPTEDEKTLWKIPRDRVYFILYTNKVVKMSNTSFKYEQTKNDISREREVLEELFSTNPIRTAFSFNQSVDAVWNLLLNEEQEKLYQEEFLPRLLVFDNQYHVDDLDDILIKEIEDMIGKVPQDVLKIILHNLYVEMEPWLKVKPPWTEEVERLNPKTRKIEKTTIVQPLSHDCHLLEKAVGVELRRRAREVVGDDLRFQDKHCELLSETIGADHHSRTHTRIRLLVDGLRPGLRAAKIVQVLESNTSSKNTWIYISDKIFNLFTFAAIRATCYASDVIVVDVDSTSSYQSQIRDLIDEIQETKTIVELTEPTNFTNEDGVKTISDYWTLNQLTSQNVFLERRVNFQGVDLALGDLEDAWSTLRQDVGGAALDILATGEKLALGIPLAAHDRHFISRSVQHHTQLDRSILEVQTAKDCFVLKGFPDEELCKLRAPHSKWQECDSSWEPSIPERSIQSETFDKFVKSFKYKYTQWTIYGKDITVKIRPSINTHWVTYSRGHIWWEGTIGDSKVVIKHIRRKSAKCADSPECFHTDEMDFVCWNDENIILTDIAGMGKTTFLKQIAKLIKDNYPTQWVYFVDLTDIDNLNKFQNNVKKYNMVDLIRDVVKTTTEHNEYDSRPMSAEIAFLRHCLETSGHITVFVDGVDEVCPMYKLKALGVLKAFREVLKHSGGKLWVAARTVLEVDLTNTLCSTTSLSLKPFTHEDQVKYLLSCWKDTLQGMLQEKKEDFVSALVNALRRATAGSGKRSKNSLCDVPLYIRMIADSYSGTQISQLFTEDTVTIESTVNRISLLQSFVEKTLCMNLEKSGVKNAHIKNVLKSHVKDVKRKFMLLAVKECFEEEKLPKTLMKRIKDVEKDLFSMTSDGSNLNTHNKYTSSSPDAELISQYGIASFNVSGNISFIHYTIAEYLAALWLHERYVSQDEPNLVQHLTESLYTREFGECRTFFDELFVGKCPLHMAALTGHNDALEKDLTVVNMGEKEKHSGRRALHFAAIGDNVRGVVRLLAAGAVATAEDSVLCWTPVRYADALMRVQYKNGVPENISHMEVIEKLLAQPGSKSRDIPRLLEDKVFIEYAVKMDYLNIIKKVTKKRFSALLRPLIKDYEMVRLAIYHESTNVLRLLKDRGFKFNKIYKNGKVTLHEAARNGYNNMCSLLLENHADVNSVNENEETPLHLAATKGYTDICQVLLNGGADVNFKDKNYCTTLHGAAGQAHKHIQRRLEKEGLTDPSVGKDKHLKLCTLLLDNGAKIDARDNTGNSVLHLAAFHGCEEVCRLFINRGLQVHLRDNARVTSLHWAALKNHEAVCSLLIEKGADVNAKDSDKYTPLHWAAMGGRVEIGKLLILRGADVNCINVDKDTPLHKAAEHGYKTFCEILIHSGANIHVKNFKGNTPLQLAAKANLETVCRFLIEKGANVDERDYKGRCSLHLVAKRGCGVICELLIQHGADIDARMLNRYTSLHMASKADYATVCLLLVKLGADIDAREGIMSRTPLHVAAERNRQSAFRTLLENGADFTLRDFKGYNVLHTISEKGYVELLNSLLIYYIAHRSKWNGPLDKRIDDNSIQLSTGKLMSFHGYTSEHGATAFIEWVTFKPLMEVCTFEGLTALHLAARAGHIDICKLLIKYGMNVNIRDKKDKTAIYYADENKHTRLQRFLQRRGAIVYKL